MRRRIPATLIVVAVAAGTALYVARIAFLKSKVLRSSSASSTRSVDGTMATPAESEEILLPTIAFSLTALVRRRPSQDEPRPDQYALVRERPPRGWWLPGGGVEHEDATPVAAAMREVVEEAGAPSPPPRLSSSTRSADGLERSLPSVTHLMQLEQSPGRIRFVFRGDWRDDFDAGATSVRTEESVLKRAPGDEESIEAKWLTWDEMQCFKDRTCGENTRWHSPRTGRSGAVPFADPWLRGPEPLEFYGKLERAQRENGPVPGLPVHVMNPPRDAHGNEQGTGVLGAFFGRMKDDSTQAHQVAGLTRGGRAALLTHLRCRLLVHDRGRGLVLVDAATRALPSTFVRDQRVTTLRRLVDRMVAPFRPLPRDGRDETRSPVGLLRVEYVIHGNGREATLTVFPCVVLASKSSKNGASLDEEGRRAASKWVAAEDVADGLERSLVRAALAHQDRAHAYCDMNLLRGKGGRI